MDQRTELLQQLATLNDELFMRGGEPTYVVAVVGRLLDDDELAEAVDQVLHEVLALREWP